jgi:hypothetical protein
MLTGTQMQTAWALWTMDLAETLETCLTEVKHKGELKCGHPKPLACGRLLYSTIHWKNRRAATPTPTGQQGLYTVCRLTCHLLANQASHTPVGPPPPGCRPAGPPDHCPLAHRHTSCCLPHEGSNTTRRQFQTCIGDTDKQNWMLKE